MNGRRLKKVAKEGRADVKKYRFGLAVFEIRF
jgi:hypothetical protein